MTNEDHMLQLREQMADIQVCLAKLATEQKHTTRMLEERKEHGVAIESKMSSMSDEFKSHVEKTNELLNGIYAKINFAAGAIAIITATASYIIQHVLSKLKGTA